MFGLRHYLPYAGMAVVTHAVVVLLAWRVLLRCGVRPWVTAAMGVVLAVMGVGAENTLWDFQIGFMGALALGLAALLVMPRSAGRPARDAVALVLLVGALMCSGQGLVVLAALTVLALLSRGVRYAALVAGVGVATYGTWWVAIGHTGMQGDHVRTAVLAGLPRVEAVGLTHPWDGLLGIRFAGAVVVVVSLAVAARHARVRRPELALATACFAGAVTLFALAGLTRAQSTAQASVGRYAYVAAVLTAPLVAMAVEALLPERVRSRLLQVVALGVVACLLATGIRAVDRYADHRVTRIGDLPQRLAAATWLGQSGQQLLADEASPALNRLAAVSQLVRAEQSGRGVRAAITPQALLEEAGILQVQVSDRRRGLPAPHPWQHRGIALERGQANGCRTGTAARPGAYVELPTAGPQELRFRTTTRVVLTQLLRDGRRSSVSQWRVQPGADHYLAVTVPVGAAVRLLLGSAGRLELCATAAVPVTG